MSRKPSSAKAIDAQLRLMFEILEKRPVPGRLRSIVDQLDDADPPADRGEKRRGGH